MSNAQRGLAILGTVAVFVLVSVANWLNPDVGPGAKVLIEAIVVAVLFAGVIALAGDDL